jgi:4-coumarate--CoA ligase
VSRTVSSRSISCAKNKMPFKSIYPDLEIPKTNILTYLLPPNQEPSDEPIWIDASDTRKSLSPRQLLQWVKRLAVGLEKLGVAKQEAVLIYTPNHIFVPVAYLGIVGSGRVFSGMNPIYTINEIVHQIKNTGAKMILAHPSLLRNAIEAGSQAGISANRIFQFSDQLQQPLYGITDWTQIAGSVSDAARYTWDPMEQTSTATIATINYSSGTTGLPKGVCVSHYNLIANAEQTIYMRDQECSYSPTERPKEKWIGFLPLYHAYGKSRISLTVGWKFTYNLQVSCMSTLWPRNFASPSTS